jgi:ParB family transcriptional regulator, chromosome partitioning protein
MSNGKKRRMSMLDNLAATGSPAPPGSMMSSNRALRSARDAVDSHHVWELDPATIDDGRIADRFDPEDVADLREAIETNGQAVPILVRRNPANSDRYLLVYGRRRLEAIRSSHKVQKVRALVANLDDEAALRTQISENMARRDLSFIEKAVFAQELVAKGFGNQSQVAEVLTVTKSSVSMAIAVAESIGPDLAAAIGPAHGIGRPRWEALVDAIEASGTDRERLAEVAEDAHTRAALAIVNQDDAADADPSVLAFEAVMKAAMPPPLPSPATPARRRRSRLLSVGGDKGGAVRRSAKGVSIDLDDGAFAAWVEAHAQDLIDELHARWIERAED